MTETELWVYAGIMSVLMLGLTLIYLYFHRKQLLALQPPKNPPELKELLTRLDRDMAAVMEDARALRRYDATVSSAASSQ
jgi:hypothetical protein